MKPESIFYIIIAIICLDFVFQLVLDILNDQYKTKPLPENVKDVYDQEEYKKSMNYQKEAGKLGYISSTFSFVTILLMVFLDGFAWVDSILEPYFQDDILQSLAFFGVLFIASDVLSLPFSIYGTFVLEEKYGFNKMTPGLFLLDKLKGYALMVIIGGGLGYFIIWLFYQFQNDFWWIAWIVMAAFTLFMSAFYTSVLLPVFNKLTPLEDGELKTELEDYANKVGFKLNRIFVMDGSKRSTRANAFFSGIGSRKTIVLYDTLIEKHTNKELVAILAHEVGHYKLKHTLKSTFPGLLQMGAMLFLLGWIMQSMEVMEALNVHEFKFHIGVIVFSVLFTPISHITGVFMNVLSRKFEYEADAFASNTYAGEPLKDGLRKLSKDNLSNLNPHPSYVFFHYSHPPLWQRLQAIDKNG